LLYKRNNPHTLPTSSTSKNSQSQKKDEKQEEDANEETTPKTTMNPSERSVPRYAAFYRETEDEEMQDIVLKVTLPQITAEKIAIEVTSSSITIQDPFFYYLNV